METNYIGFKYHTEPKYDHTGPFVNGRSYVEKNYRSFYIGPSKKIKVSYNRKRELDECFQENLLLYATSSGYGFLNRQGKVSIPAKFETAERFHSSRAIISKEGKFGAINRKGDIVIPAKYEELGNFSDGLASFKDKLYGYLDRKGNIVIEEQFVEAGPFREGLAKVLKTGRKHKCFINTSGEEVFNTIKFEYVSNFDEGYAVVKRHGLFGYIDFDGDILIPPAYHHAKPFSQGLAAVATKNGLYGYINTQGKQVIDFNLQEAGKFKDVACVKYKHGWGLINRTGLFVVCPQFTRLSLPSLDLVAYCVYGGCGYLKLH